MEFELSEVLLESDIPENGSFTFESMARDWMIEED